MSVSSCLQRALLLLQREHVLLAVDLRDDRVALHVEFGAAHVVPRLQQRHRVLALRDGQIRFGFLDLLVHRLDAEARFFERALAFAIVVLDDQVLLFGQRPHRRQIGHLHGAEQVGRGQRHGARGTQFAAGIRANHHIAALHFGGWDRILPFRHLLVIAVAVPAARHQDRQPESTKNCLFHGKSRFLRHAPNGEARAGTFTVSSWPASPIRPGFPASRRRLPSIRRSR